MLNGILNESFVRFRERFPVGHILFYEFFSPKPMRIILYTRTRKLEWDWPDPLARRLVRAYSNHAPGKPITVLSLLDQIGQAPKPGDDTFCGWYSLSLNQYRRIIGFQMKQDMVEIHLFNDQIRESVTQLLQRFFSFVLSDHPLELDKQDYEIVTGDGIKKKWNPRTQSYE